jgi:hypothetical protein
MTHLTALRNSVLCGLAVVAAAGCGATRQSGNLTGAASAATTPSVATGAAVAATSPAQPTPTPATGAINQQISSIDNQLGSVGSQLNAASAGLSTSEGDPSQ